MQIIITDNKNDYIRNRKVLLSEKVYEEKEFLKKLYNSFDDRSLAILFNHSYKLSTAKEILDYLPFITKSFNNKTEKLLEIKNELIKHNLEKNNQLFREYIKDKKIIITYESSKSFLNKLKALNYQILIKKNKKHTNNVYEFINEEEEIINVVDDIIKNIDNVALKDIGLIFPNEYEDIVKRYLNIYNLKINTSELIVSSNVVNDFINLLNQNTIAKTYELIVFKYPESKYLNIIKNIINSLSFIDENDIKKDIIVNKLKMAKYQYNYDDALERVSLPCFSKKKLYLLGFNSSFPKVYKDEDLLLDEEKKYYDIETSIEKNILIKKRYYKFITENNIYISYAKTFDNKEKMISSLYDEKNFTIMKINNDKKIIYSRKAFNILYASLLDKYEKYKEIDYLLPLFKNTTKLRYKNYNNQFKGLVPKESISLSYTALQNYYECSFKYYLEKILDIKPYEDKISAKIGSYMHAILENVDQDNFDLEEFKCKYYIDNNFNIKESFFADNLDDEIKETIAFIKKFHKQSELKDIYKEIEMTYKIDDNISVYGIADKVMTLNKNNKIYGALIDYKSGDAKLNLTMIKHGLNMQLFIYYLLFKNYFKNSKIVGVYLQKVLNNDLKEDSVSKDKSLKLEGYSTDDLNVIKMLDYEYEDSQYIKGMGLTKEGEVKKAAKVLSVSDFEKYRKLVEDKIREAALNIINGIYEINPKFDKNNNNLSCRFCPFKDICFKDDKDKVVLMEDDDEVE